MSLLMKALEKAARDRSEARNEAGPAASSPAAAEPKRELSLEPIAPARAAAASPAAAPAPRPAAPPRPAVAPPTGTAGERVTRDPVPQDAAQARASTILRAQTASRPPEPGIVDYVRSHPVLVFGALAGVFAIGFGIYVYLQVFHPGLFVARPPAPPPAAPVARAPVPATPAPAPSPAVQPPLSSEPLLKEAAEAATAATLPAVAAAPESPRPRPAPKRRAATEPEAAPRNAIEITAGSDEPVLNPLHQQAYDALRAGRMDEARRLYGDLARAEPQNVQALLGLAAIAAHMGNTEEASAHFLRVLELEPRNALAQSGLIALLGRADPLAAETRLKQLIAQEPSAHLHFTLGNLYAEQSQWAAAQQSFFQAHHLDPANPDYAYNLAVALDHIGQPRLALGFYRRALELARSRGRAHFSLAQARERVDDLARRVE